MRNRILVVLLATALIVGALLFSFDYQKSQSTPASQEASPSGVVLINEIMTKNPDVVPDETGQFPDWAELYNPGGEDVDLSGWGLSDTVSEVKWVFPSGTVLPAGGYLVVYCSGQADGSGEGALHASFKLSAQKDVLVLTNPAGQVVDQAELVEITDTHSLGRTPEDTAQWVDFELPTPGFVNDESGRAQYMSSMEDASSGLLINELQANNVTTLPGENGEYPDWLELYNPTAADVDISGWGLTDNPLKPLKWRFPEGTKIKSGELLLVLCTGQVDTQTEGTLQASFRLSGYRDTVLFTNARGRTVDEVSFAEVPADASYGRSEEGGSWQVMTQPTPGFPNDESGYEQYQQLYALAASGIYVSEVMLYNESYAKDDDGQAYDWVEIHNATGQTVDLSGFGLTNNAKNPGKWRFPEGTTLEPDGYLMLMASGLSPEEAKKKSSTYLHLTYKLSNADGDVLTLWNAQDQLIDKIACSTQRRMTSYGRSEAGGFFLHYPSPTPGKQNGIGYTGYAKMPEIRTDAGVYNGTQRVEIDVPQGTTVRYTLDGSVPAQDSAVYQGPVEISKTSVLRARAFSENASLLGSETATASYFIGSPHNAALSIVSLSTDAENFFDPETGIYAKGPNASEEFPYKGANFWQEWERPVHAEIFGPGGIFQYGDDMAIRIFGAFSRAREQKGLALIARTTYGNSRIEYPLFENRPYEQYKSIVLRASGQDCTVTLMRDIIATSLVDGTTNLEVQAYRQAVVYLNGEYFGIYNIREKVTKYFLADHYGLTNPDNLDILVGDNTVVHGSKNDYMDLLEYCEDHDLSVQENYEYVKTQMDVDNYIDYLFCEMYVANTDTGNIKYFRERSSDPEKSKWRWIYYDFCWSFSNYKMNSIEYLTNPEGHGVGKGFSTFLTRSLMKNQDFRNQFLRRSAELLNTIYTTENVLARIEECEARITDEIERQIERWPEGVSKGNWKANVNLAKTFAEKRPGYLITHLKNYFSLSNSECQRIFGQMGTPLDADGE